MQPGRLIFHFVFVFLFGMLWVSCSSPKKQVCECAPCPSLEGKAEQDASPGDSFSEGSLPEERGPQEAGPEKTVPPEVATEAAPEPTPENIPEEIVAEEIIPEKKPDDGGPLLRIYAKNPHYLEYEGHPFVTMPFALDFSKYRHTRKLGGVAINWYRYSSSRRKCGVHWTKPENLPYTSGEMEKGFNETYWKNLKNSVARALQKKEILIVNVWATTRLEYGRPNEVPSGCNYKDPGHPNYWAPDRFEASIWSELRGGPIPKSGHPKDNFYTLHSPGTALYGKEKYRSSWDWKKKNQYRQEEVLKKIYDTLKGYPNWMLQVMYEMSDTGSTTKAKVITWTHHVIDYYRSLEKSRLHVYCGGLLRIQGSIFDKTKQFDVLSSEGATVTPDVPKKFHDSTWFLKVPVLYKGFDPLNKAGKRMDNQDNIPDDYENDIGYNHNLAVIRNFVVWGIGPSPFFHYTQWDKQNLLNKYAVKVADFLEKVKTWQNEPGDEITSSTVPKP